MKHYILTLTALLFLTNIVPAQEKEQTQEKTAKTLYERYLYLYGASTDSAEAFYKLSAEIQQFYLQKGKMNKYYDYQHNEILYEAAKGHHMEAIKKANAMLEEMKSSKEGTKYFDLVYIALGIVFDQRGNFYMANHYLEEAAKHIESVAPDNHDRLAHAYTELVRVNLCIDYDKAWLWNERMNSLTLIKSPYYHEQYLFYKTYLFFLKKDIRNFLKTKREYEEYVNDYDIYPRNDAALEYLEEAMNGKYDNVHAQQAETKENGNITQVDGDMRLLDAVGRPDLAIQLAYRRIYMQDSLNNELINENLNELNVAMGMTKLQEEAAREREFWMIVAIGLLAVAFALLIWRYFTRRRYMEQLEIALDEAQESDRMKSTFIQHISHEMRTPLNIVTGFVQIIANPDYELEEEERNRLLKAIDENTTAITDIVNNLLEVSLESSKARYHRDDKIAVNNFCQRLIDTARERYNGSVELHFESSLPDDLTIQSNQNGIKSILKQLLSNALKFTDQGQVTLSISQEANSDNVRFAVTDTGIGIPEEHHEQVFEQFYKVDDFKQGLGIGLTISRKIATLLGGTLIIDNAYKDGTRMILTIPAE